VRDLLFERDGGICSLCGLDTVALREAFVRACFEMLGRPRAYSIDHRRPKPVLLPVFERLRALDLDPHRHTYWDADHVVPVIEGGGECGLDGYRTVCVPCHKRVSREQKAARRQAA
jgi:hypothetical protein